ncbi:hypothetical protein ACLKA6_018411 [Drosophila palustris]
MARIDNFAQCSRASKSKTMDGWKKAWTDWKGVIKSKMAHNRRESVATGGGPYDQKCLQPAEEEIAVLCGLYKLVNGVKGTHTFGDKPNSPITIPQSFDEDEGRKENKKNTEMMVTSTNQQQSVAKCKTTTERSVKNRMQF